MFGAKGGNFSFASEEPVRHGSGVIARDVNGDGYPDFSVGTLAGFFYDGYGVALLQATSVLPQYMEQPGAGYGGLP